MRWPEKIQMVAIAQALTWSSPGVVTIVRPPGYFFPSLLDLWPYKHLHADVWKFSRKTKNHQKWPYREYPVFTGTQPVIWGTLFGFGFSFLTFLSFLFPILVLFPGLSSPRPHCKFPFCLGFFFQTLKYEPNAVFNELGNYSSFSLSFAF